MELYYGKYGNYPNNQAVSAHVCNSGLNAYTDIFCRDSTDNSGATPIVNWIPGLNEFVSTLPHNPKPYASNAGYPYHYYSDGVTYFLEVNLENSNKSDCVYPGGTNAYPMTSVDITNNVCAYFSDPNTYIVLSH